jgi:transcriptional regulator GlxA family with amidase domain
MTKPTNKPSTAENKMELRTHVVLLSGRAIQSFSSREELLAFAEVNKTKYLMNWNCPEHYSVLVQESNGVALHPDMLVTKAFRKVLTK